ncbi:MAG TPA: hypothetical protein VEQ36_01220 [Thermomicrobiales bacterium]|nr:hypothetical protein [Thermomicrobiales bacterium]
MITPLVNSRGRKLGFVAEDAVYDTRGRRLGTRTGVRVVNERGAEIGEISGNIYRSHRSTSGLRATVAAPITVVSGWLRNIRDGKLDPVADA